MNFNDLGAHPDLNAILENRGIKSPTEIQKLVFSPIVEGNSVLGLSKTGSGKTLAYLLPLVQMSVVKREAGAPQNDEDASRVLVLCPTRELAHQIFTEIQALHPQTPKVSLLIVGGDSEAEQLKGFAASRYLVATPGRLLDLIKNSGLSLNSVQRVVLDEADRLLDMGFQEDIRDILGRVPKGFQLVCLSATLHLGVEELIYEMGVEFVRVTTSSDADMTVEGLDHRVAFVGDQEKFHFLVNFLKERQDQRGIIFSNYRESAHRISKRLEGLGYRAEALSAQLSQPQRRKIMEGFRAETLDILVASDVAARGLDVDALDFVVNFDLPDDSATYVHRVGRTARAGRQGVAVSLVGFEDAFRLEKLESYLKMPIERFVVDPLWLDGPLPRGKHSAPHVSSAPRPAVNHNGSQQRAPHASQQRQGEPGRDHRRPAPAHHHAAKSTSASAAKPAPKSWWQRAVNKLLSLLGVRPASAKALPVGGSSANRDQRPAGSGSRHRSGQNRNRNQNRRRGPGGPGQQSARGQDGRESPRGGRRDGRRRPRPAGGPRRDGER